VIEVSVVEAETNSPPQVEITSPDNGSQGQENQQIQFSAQANDDEDGDISGQIVWSSNLDGQIGNGAVISSQLSPGTHQVVASVSDSEGLENQSTIEFIVNAIPNVQITSPTENTVIQQDLNIDLVGEATDSEDGDLSSIIVWSSSLDGALGTGAALNVSLSTGEHILTAQVEDSSGASYSTNTTIRVNAKSTLSITSPGSGAELDVFESVLLNATANDPEDGDISSNIQWTSNVDGNLGQGTGISVQLSEGEHQLTATVTDSDGLAATESITITMSNATGTATVSWTAPTHNTDDSELDDLTGYKIYYGQDADNLIDYILVEDPSQTSYVVEGLFTNTVYYFSVVACNSLGIESDLSNIASKDFVNQ
ncbi:MAG: fibronectin type III domain-containing protein, partial [Kangiellaceae bacterium]|nr:fibronectin type III domain-containing protein [Kangiellaceae bacterium]